MRDKQLKVLFLGDICGKDARKYLQKVLPRLRQTHEVDLVIANGENAAHGKGLTRRVYQELKNCGIDVLTTGNHVFAKREILDFLDEVEDILVPENYYHKPTGRSYIVLEIKGRKIAIVSLLGKVLMTDNIVQESPFPVMERLLTKIKADLIFVDLHAEATSEKITFAYFFKDRLQTVVGTHTHVQTADERIVDGCAMITDVGMCGVYHSIIGRDIEEITNRTVYNLKTTFQVATGKVWINGVFITYDLETLQAIKIERYQQKEE